MKKWKAMAAGLVTLSVLTAGLTASSAVSAAEIRKADSSVQTYKDGAVVPASKAPAVRKPSVRQPVKRRSPIITLPRAKSWIRW